MTNHWPLTIFSEARQITALLRWPAMPGDDQPPAHIFRALRAEKRAAQAAMFLGQALPRFEAVAWAAHAVTHCPSRLDEQALAAVHAWLRDPSDTHRRAAERAARAIRGTSAALLCAQAVFVAGGSLAPADMPPVAAPKDATGRLAAAAVLTASANDGDPGAALDRALDFGNMLASGETV